MLKTPSQKLNILFHSIVAFRWPSRCGMWVTHLFCSFSGGSALIWGNPVTEASQRQPISVQLLSAPRPKNKQNDELDAHPHRDTVFTGINSPLPTHSEYSFYFMILWASHCFNISASFTCFCERLLCLCLISVQICRWSNSPCLQTYPAVLNLSPLKRVIKFRVVQSAFTTKFDDFFPVYVQIYVFFLTFIPWVPPSIVMHQ